MRILLAGQPNCGKTTLFNRLTGRREHTGNRAGVTVSCARARLRGREEELVDLPGLYSLTGGGPDEQAARRALETEAPDLILNVVDSTALRRSLVLTLQLLALGRPTAVLLNMADEARQRGIRIDRDRLSKMLGVPVFFVSARTGEGLGDVDRLLQAGRISARRPSPSPEELYREAGRIASAVLSGNIGGRPRGADRLLLHPFWGLPAFGLVLGLVFLLTFQWVGPWLGRGVEAVVDGVKSSLAGTVLDTPLLREGLLGSLGYVLSFLPVITVLSLLLNLLEDVGYLPRAAFLLDGFLRGLGLDGRCAVPLLLGFGCTVPAVMATRTLPEGEKRRRTMDLLPFVPCSARLPFLLLLGSVLLPEHPARGALLFYGISLCLGILCAALSKPAERGSGFYLELPPLRMPRWQSVVKETGAAGGHGPLVESAGGARSAPGGAGGGEPPCRPGKALTAPAAPPGLNRRADGRDIALRPGGQGDHGLRRGAPSFRRHDPDGGAGRRFRHRGPAFAALFGHVGRRPGGGGTKAAAVPPAPAPASCLGDRRHIASCPASVA